MDEFEKHPKWKELTSLCGQIEKLQKEAELARKNELTNAIADIHAKMKEYNLSAEDLGLGSKRKPMKMVRRPVAPKYLIS